MAKAIRKPLSRLPQGGATAFLRIVILAKSGCRYVKFILSDLVKKVGERA